MRLRRADFYFGLYETRQVPEICSGVRFISGTGGKPADLIPASSQWEAPASGYWLRRVPSYLQPEILPGYRVKEIRDREGYAISLDGVNDLESYLKTHIKPRMRTSVRNNPKKLEALGHVSRHLYYGNLEKDHYHFLMDTMQGMLAQRFEEKGASNERLPEWERLVKLFYPLILEKKASLYVISMNDKPMAISFNYHLGPVFFLAIPAFDTQYARFAPGHMLIADQITWCVEHGYKMIDMSMGDLRYKHDWCNREYYFSQFLIYKNGSARAGAHALAITIGLTLRQQAKRMGLNRAYRYVRKVNFSK